MSVWINRRDYKKYGHAYSKKNAKPGKFAGVLEKEADDNYDHICEPQQIGDDEKFTKWNVVINEHMDFIKICCYLFFQIRKPGKVNKHV